MPVRYVLRFLTKYYLPLTTTAAFVAVLMLWAGFRPAGVNGVMVTTPWFIITLFAASPGEEWNQKKQAEVSWPGSLQIIIYDPDDVYHQADWGMVRAGGSRGYYSFSDIEKFVMSPMPIIVRASHPTCTILCCGYPQAAVWTALLTIVAVIFARRKLRVPQIRTAF